MAEGAEFRGTDRFAVIRSLGAGGMGAVYAVLDRERNEHVALKTLRRPDGQLLYRLKQEFRSLSQMHHPNLVRLGELVEAGGTWFFTMELLEGHDFLQWVRPGLPVPESDSTIAAAPAARAAVAAALDAATITALSGPGSSAVPTAMGSYPELPLGHCDHDRLRVALVGLARGLIALHDAGLVHRDVKPSNLIVARDERVVLLDFGLVRTSSGPVAGEEGQVMGTPAYMAPEQISPAHTEPSSDWYAVGVMMYQALTGRLPFSGSALHMFAAKARERPPLRDEDGPDDLRALCHDLMDPEPERRPDGRAVLARLGAEVEPSTEIRTQGGLLLGREVERGALDDALARAAAGHAVVCYVTGPSGMGKTALVDDFLDEVRERDDVVVLRGRCYERESVPYKALDSVIDDLALHLKALHRYDASLLVPDNVGALAQVFPVLGQVATIAAAPPERGRDPARVKQRALTCLRELLTRLARSRRLVLAIDDLHWGDADSAGVLAELLGPPDPPPLLLVGTYRSEADPGPIVKALAPRPGAAEVSEILVEPLSESQAVELATHLLEGKSDADVLATSIASESGGSPFFVGEMVRYLRTAGAGAPVLSLERAIESRLAQLGEGPRRLLEVVALVGQPIAQGLAARAAGIPLDVALAQLRAQHLVRSHGARERDKVEVYHDRIREAVAGGLGAAREKELRAALANALIETDWADPDQIGVDVLAAVDPSRARQAVIASAERAATALAFDRAAALYGVATSMTDDAAHKRRLTRARADVLAYAGRGEEAARDYLSLAAATAGDERLELERFAAENLLRGGHIVDGMRHLSGVLERLGANVPAARGRAVARLLWTRARLGLRGLDFRRRDEAELAPRDLARVDALFAAASTFAMVDHLRGAAPQTEHLLRALRLGEERRVCRALVTEVGYLAAQGGRGPERADAVARRVVAIADRIHDPYLVAAGHLGIGIAAFFSTKYRVAVDACLQADRGIANDVIGAWWERTMTRYFLCLAQINAGDFAGLARSVAEAVGEAERRRDVFARNLFASHPTVWRQMIEDRTANAEAAVEATLDGWPTDVYYQAHHVAVIARTMIRLYDGDAAGAAALIDESMPMVRSLLIHRLPFVMGEVHKVRGQAAIRTGDLAVATSSARAMSKIGVPVGAGFAASMRAAIAAGRGDATTAASELGTAIDRFVETGSAHDAAACRWRLGETLGGARGDRLTGEARTWLESAGVAAPARMVDFLAPRWRA